MITLLPVIFILTAGILLSFLWADFKKDTKMARYYEEVAMIAASKERTSVYEYKSSKGRHYEASDRCNRKCS
ncbi:MAG: hypothetical protein SOT05_03745 [Anaerovoracaceae bacterium]|nr:hypothetical protein [Anaerovoracaceae bacterium]